MWTPSLTDGEEIQLPFGLIFSTFMVCCMAGSSLFSIQIERMKGEKLAVAVFGTAAMAMFIVSMSTSRSVKFLAMNVFELTVGMYFPIMGTMKGAF
jgi:MFS transporter, MFS domain-containing protein family, molybdate-anion transporter